MMLRRNVLIFHQGALGDFVLTWPLAMALGRVYAQSRIIYVTPEGKGALAERVLGVEWSDVEGGWGGLFRDSADLPEAPARRLAGAHTVVSFVAEEGDVWMRNVRASAPDASMIALRPAGADEDAAGRHACEALVDQLGDWPMIQAALEQMIRSVSARGTGYAAAQRFAGPAGETNDRADGPLVVIHPGSGSREKCWGAERFLELIDRLQGEGKRVRVVLGEVELERWDRATIGRFESAAPTHRPADYLELLEQLVPADVLVSNDSGPAHLGGMIGVPTVCLFGPTDPAVWRPLGPNVKAIRRQPLAELTVEEVGRAVASC